MSWPMVSIYGPTVAVKILGETPYLTIGDHKIVLGDISEVIICDFCSKAEDVLFVMLLPDHHNG